MGNSNGFEVDLEKVLGNKGNTYVQLYLNCALSDVCCIKRLEDLTSIIDVTRKMCEK